MLFAFLLYVDRKWDKVFIAKQMNRANKGEFGLLKHKSQQTFQHSLKNSVRYEWADFKKHCCFMHMNVMNIEFPYKTYNSGLYFKKIG